MSFIGKAVKKVFSISKKIWKGAAKIVKKAWDNKWVRAAVIVGLSVFTVGLAAGGFAAFSAASAAAGGGIGGFFSAVGTTMATGFSTIGAAFGVGAGAAPAGATAAATSAAPTLSAAAGGTGLGLGTSTGAVSAAAAGMMPGAVGTGVTGAMAAGGTTAGVMGGATTAGASLGSRILASVLDPGIKGQFIRSAAIGGISNWAKMKEEKRARRRANKATVWGGPAFGGSEELPDGFIKKPLESIRDREEKGQQQTSQAFRFAKEDNTNPMYDVTKFRPSSSTLLGPMEGRATQLKDRANIQGLLNPATGVPIA